MTTNASFLADPDLSPAGQALLDDDLAELGFVMNASRLWAYQPEAVGHLFELMSEVLRTAGLTFRHRGLLVVATAATLGDSYCSLAWGGKLASAGAGDAAVSAIRGDDGQLSPQERTMVGWARKVAADPNGTTAPDVEQLRTAGFTDSQIFSITSFVALRLAFSTVNDALGATPDVELIAATPPALTAAVTYGRQPTQSLTSSSPT